MERLTGQGYGDAIRSRVLAPLGMTASEPAITNALRPRLAVGYASLYDDRPAHPNHPLVPATWLETENGDGSLASTPEDMAVYLRMLLNRGRGRGSPPLRAGFAAMTQRIIAIRERRADLLRVRNLRVNGRRPQLRRPPRGHGRLFRGMIGDLDDGLGAVAIVNGPGNPNAIAFKALALLRAARRGDTPAAAPEPPDPTLTDDAAAYAGAYRGDTGTLRLVAEDDRLVLKHDGERLVLEPYHERHLHRPASGVRSVRVPLRPPSGRGEVVELFHGGAAGTSTTATRVRPSSARPPNGTPSRATIAPTTRGRPIFRVVHGRGGCSGCPSVAPDGFEDEQPLVPLGDGSFRAGADDTSPERVRFDVVVDGKALRAVLSDGSTARDFTP